MGFLLKQLHAFYRMQALVPGTFVCKLFSRVPFVRNSLVPIASFSDTEQSKKRTVYYVNRWLLYNLAVPVVKDT